MRSRRVKVSGPVLLAACFFIFSIVFAPSAPSAATASEKKDEERPFKIGVIGPETGEESDIGRMTFDGAALAADDFNKSGGAGSRPIELIKMDNRGSSAATNAGVEKLIAQRVFAIIGAPTGWSTLIPVYASNESKTVFISAGTRRKIGSSGSYAFNVSLPIEKAAEVLIDYCAANGKKEFFLITTVMDDEALNVASAFKKAVQKKGVRIKGEHSVITEDEFAVSVKMLKSLMPVDGVIFAGGSAAVLSFLNVAAKQGIRVPIIGGEDIYNEEFLAGGDMVDGSLLYTGFFPDTADPVTRRFVESYKAKTGRIPGGFSADAYDTFMLIAGAAKNTGSTSTEKIRDELLNVKDYQGVGGTIGINKEHNAFKNPYILKVAKKDNSYYFSLVKNAREKQGVTP